MKISARFKEYEHGATKGFVDFVVDNQIVIKGARLVEGEFGKFVSLPQKKVGDEYKDVITGVNHNFSAKLLDAALMARENDEHHVTIGESEKLYFVPRVNLLEHTDGPLKAMASMMVKESKESEKSLFTMSGIRVLDGEHGLFLGMPSEKTQSEEYPYSKICFFTESSKDFLGRLIIGKAMDMLGIEKKHGEKKGSIADQVAEAKNIADGYEASDGPSMNFDELDEFPFER